MEYLKSQFGHPRGFIGSLAGAIMAWENKERNGWAISLLDLQSTDHVLEIGFGPGWAIEQMAEKVVNGLVAGADASETMVRDASRRNAASIRAGRVHLKHAPATQLPFADGAFDKALAVNSFQAWGDQAHGLQEIKRVLKPGGRAVITVQPVWVKTEAEALALGEAMRKQLVEAGFKSARLETKLLKPMAVSAMGMKA